MANDLTAFSSSASSPSPSLRDVVMVLFRQRRLLLSSFGFIVIVVLAWGFFAPSYKAEMKVMLRRSRLDPELTPTATLAPLIVDASISEEELNSETDLMQQDDILRTVVKNSGLSARRPWWPWKFWSDSEEVRMALATRRLAKRLNVEPIRKSSLIAVTYTSSDPQQAAVVLRCLAVAYLEKHQQVRRPAGEFKFYERQMLESKRDLDAAESQFMIFSRREGVVAASTERDFTLKKLSDTEANYRETQISIGETRRRLGSLATALETLPLRATTVIRSAENAQLLAEMKSKLLDLKIRRRDLLSKFQPSYRVVQEVDQQISEAQAGIAAETESPVRDVTTQKDQDRQWAEAELLKNRVELNALEARESATATVLSGYSKAAGRLGDQAIEQEELLRTVKAAEDKYLLYVSKREESRISDALDKGGILNATIAEAPDVPALPVWSMGMFGVVGILTGGTISTVLAFSADYFSTGFRDPDEVLAYLGSPVLASFPVNRISS